MWGGGIRNLQWPLSCLSRGETEMAFEGGADGRREVGESQLPTRAQSQHRKPSSVTQVLAGTGRSGTTSSADDSPGIQTPSRPHLLQPKAPHRPVRSWINLTSSHRGLGFPSGCGEGSFSLRR